MSTELYAQQPKHSESVLINGKEMYYEVYGEGEPLILLHGYSLSSISWHTYISDFEDDYKVYLIDLPGHGKSAPFSEQLSINKVAVDLKALLQHLGINHTKAIGFSFGGDVLYQLALLNPELISSMITVGAVGSWDIKNFPQYLEVYTYENIEKFPWLKTAHASTNHVKGILNQFKHYTVYLSDEDISRIQAEVFVIIGDDDEGMDLAEVARLKKNLTSSDVWILPDVAHGAHEGEHKAEFVSKAKRFLSKNTKQNDR